MYGHVIRAPRGVVAWQCNPLPLRNTEQESNWSLLSKDENCKQPNRAAEQLKTVDSMSRRAQVPAGFAGL